MYFYSTSRQMDGLSPVKMTIGEAMKTVSMNWHIHSLQVFVLENMDINIHADWVSNGGRIDS